MPQRSCSPLPFGRLIAAITQHIPDKSFQLVRYYSWYSNKMRGQRKKRAEEEEKEPGDVDGELEVIDVSEHQPYRIPSTQWRALFKKGWNAAPLICPTCPREMCIVSLIDERDVIEKMLKCLGLWQRGVRVDSQDQTGTDPPRADWVYEPVDQDLFPDYDTQPVLLTVNA